MAAGTVRVKGLSELQRDFRKMGGELPREVRQELKRTGEVVRTEAVPLFEDISPRSASGYRVRVRIRGVAVEQSRKRTTGRRPDFGALQMRRALIPALERRQQEVFSGLERMLDRLAGENGF